MPNYNHETRDEHRNYAMRHLAYLIKSESDCTSVFYSLMPAHLQALIDRAEVAVDAHRAGKRPKLATIVRKAAKITRERKPYELHPAPYWLRIA